jgi:phosphoglycerate dehydrogenase-like enzyme
MTETQGPAAFSVGVMPETQHGDIGLGMLDEAGVPWTLVKAEGGIYSPQLLSSYPAFLTGGTTVSAAALEAADPPPLILARFGIGTDMIDLEACTREDVVVTIAPDGAARPVAVAGLALVLASTLNMYAKDQLVRTGDWGAQRRLLQGIGLQGRTVGIVGLGNIGRILAGLLRPLEPVIVGSDPYVKPELAAEAGVQLLALDELLTRSDVVVITCALTPETRHLIGARELALMKPRARLVNIARGPIVEHNALVDALRRGVIKGAGLDVFEEEPLPADDPLVGMGNVTITPHGLAWTDQWARDTGGSAIRAILDVRAGRVPKFVANKAVLERPSFQARLREMAERD